MPLVSALVPTYDRPEFVGGAVETALDQTHEEIEVVVVCDPPAEATRSTLAPYADDDRVRVLYNDRWLGLAASRNRAIEAARGEYVCVLDDDDRWHPRKIEKQLAAIEGLDDDWGVVYTGGTIRRGGRTVGVYEPTRRGTIYPDVLATFDLQPYSSHMIRAECFERVGRYDTDFRCGEDWDHTIRLACEYKFEYVPESLVARTFHQRNVSREQLDPIPFDLRDGIGVRGRIWAKYREEIERRPAISERFQYERALACARIELDRGNHRRAFRHGLQAVRSNATLDALLVLAFACLGRRSLDAARQLRNSWMDRQLATSTFSHP